MSITEIMQSMSKIPYATLQDFIEASYNDEEYKDFHVRSVITCNRTHDPKGFRINEILANIFYGDEDAIIDFIKENLK